MAITDIWKRSGKIITTAALISIMAASAVFAAPAPQPHGGPGQQKNPPAAQPVPNNQRPGQPGANNQKPGAAAPKPNQPQAKPAPHNAPAPAPKPVPAPQPPQPHDDGGSNATGALVTGAILGAVLTTVINNSASN